MSDIVERLSAFVSEWSKIPSNGNGIYGLHSGTDREVELNVSDLTEAADEIACLQARVAELEGIVRECGVQIRMLAKDAGRSPDSLLIEISQALKGGA